MNFPGAAVAFERPVAPWWLGGGEACPHCCQAYALETECRCAACDCAVCVHCAVLVRALSARLCPPCHAEMGEDGGMERVH
jgi:hypothetical protein